MPELRNVGAFLSPPGGDSGPNINWAIQQRHRIDLGQFDLGMELRSIFFCGCPFPKPVLVDIIMFYFVFYTLYTFLIKNITFSL